MQWLLDSDVIWKLATFDLLNELLGVLVAKKTDLFYLPELHYQLKSRRIWEKHDHDAIRRVLEFVKGIKRITMSDPVEQIILHAAKATYQNRPERIDGGEQLLFMATKTLQLSIISTHDKKSLRTLANDSTCKAIHQRVKGRVMCLEQIVVRMIDKYGYKHIQEKIGPLCAIDEVMLHSFANGKTDHSEAECLKWLRDYIQRLNAETSNVLVVP